MPICAKINFLGVYMDDPRTNTASFIKISNKFIINHLIL